MLCASGDGREVAPRYRVCQKCRHGAPVPCPECDGLKRPEAERCAPCHRKRRGPLHGAWKGGRIIDKQGYVRVYTPDDPRANCGRYMKEHVLVIEQAVGRKLRPGESVHHKNGVRSDNRIDNLELWYSGQPSGQRVGDLLAWAREIIETYGPYVEPPDEYCTPENCNRPEHRKGR